MQKELFSPTDSFLEFTCAICLCVPYPTTAVFSTLACQHVFCTACLLEWKQRGAMKCPTCNREIPSDEQLLVQQHCPLGFRLLNRLQIKCSLKNCKWVGDYGNLDAHLTSSDTHLQENQVSGLKEAGNERYVAGRYLEAIRLYDKALATKESDPGLLYANRAACFLKLNMLKEAVDSCAQAFACGNTEVKLLLRWANALIMQFDFKQACLVLEKIPPRDVGNRIVQCRAWAKAWDESELCIQNAEYEQAQVSVSLLLQCPLVANSPKVLARAALVEAHVGDVNLALRLSLDSCRKEPMEDMAWVARAYALCSNGDFKEAGQNAKQALRINPDSTLGKQCFKYIRSVETKVHAARECKGEEARELLKDLVYGTLLPKRSPLRVQLLAERAQVSYVLMHYTEALEDCALAIDQKPDCQRAWMTRFYCLRKLERFKEAVEDAKMLMETWGAADVQIRSLCEKAEFDYRRSKRPDFYQVLGGISTLSSEMEIKQAYKHRALVVHPDKAVGEEDRKRKEEEFKLLGQALEILGNADSRELYDKGYDVQGIKDELERRKRRHH